MWPTLNEVEMPELLWYAAEEGTRSLREIGISEWICHGRPTHPTWEGPEDTPSTTLANAFVRRGPAAVVSLFFK